MPIERKDLGEEIWRLDFKEHDVYLLVNEKTPGLEDQARSDPLFYAAVYPEVVRRVLTAAFREGASIDEEGEDRWPHLWLRFGKSLHPTKENPPDEPYEDENHEEHDDWIDEVVRAFCDQHSMRSKYANALENGYGGEG